MVGIKKIMIIVGMFVIVLLLTVVLISIANVERHVLYTENINDYGAKQYSVPGTIFPAEIPLNAQVVSFSYYNYWHEAKDIYLELKFNSCKEMEQYLLTLKKRCIKFCEGNSSVKEEEWLVEEDNIYNELYVDLFCTIHVSYQNGKCFSGYIIESDSDKSHFNCNFGTISYSYSELTVIHSYVRGLYRDSVHNYIPKYFERFNVPLNENHERLIYLDR